MAAKDLEYEGLHQNRKKKERAKAVEFYVRLSISAISVAVTCTAICAFMLMK